MSGLFLDTSALVKLYVLEPGSESLVAAADPASLTILDLARVEFASAVWRRRRSGDMEEAQADMLVRRLDEDLEQRIGIVSCDAALIGRACRLVRAHALRGYDALHLAAAVAHGRSLFVASDAALLAAARAEGLLAWDPSTGAAPPTGQ